MRTPFDGRSRAPLRIVVGLVAAVNLVVLSFAVATTPRSAISHPGAFPWLLAVGGRPAFVVPATLIGLFALYRFLRRPAALFDGAVAFFALQYLCEAHAALIEGPMRIFFTGGATLAGWLTGLAFARIAKRSRSGDEDAEGLAEMGAVSGLAATYVGASISKLVAGGLLWADADTMRAIILSQRSINAGSLFDGYARIVVLHPMIAWWLAVLTLVIQSSAVLYPWSPRLRIWVGTGLLLFHINVALLTGIEFVEASVLLIAFSYPWTRLFGAPIATRTEAALDPALDRRASIALAVGAAFLLCAVALPPVRKYTHEHHRLRSLGGEEHHEREDDRGAEIRPAFLGELEPGDDLAGWRCRSIRQQANGDVSITVTREERSFVVRVAARSDAVHAPIVTARRALFYEMANGPLRDDDWEPVLEAIAARVRVAEPEAR